MTKKGVVTIQGKNYVTVARRVELAHEEKALESVVTEVLNHHPVVVKATVHIKGQPFTGISAVDPESNKMIERQNPYEVAETSAVGRALGFAGYGLLESIASADEVNRAVKRQGSYASIAQAQRLLGATSTNGNVKGNSQQSSFVARAEQKPETVGLSSILEKEEAICRKCGEKATKKKGVTKGGKPYHGIFCSTNNRAHTEWLWN